MTSRSTTSITIPSWALGILVPTLITIAISMGTLAYRAGGAITTLEVIGKSLEQLALRVERLDRSDASNTSRLDSLEQHVYQRSK